MSECSDREPRSVTREDAGQRTTVSSTPTPKEMAADAPLVAASGQIAMATNTAGAHRAAIVTSSTTIDPGGNGPSAPER